MIILEPYCLGISFHLWFLLVCSHSTRAELIVSNIGPAPAVDDCSTTGRTMVWLSVLSIPFNSLLFLIRVKGVFHDSKLVQYFFTMLWLMVLAGASFQPSCVKFTTTEIGGEEVCLPTTVHSYCTTTPIVVMVNDTSVLFAISIKLLLSSLSKSWIEMFILFFGGSPHHIPASCWRLSETLMRSGQQYYLQVVPCFFQ